LVWYCKGLSISATGIERHRRLLVIVVGAGTTTTAKGETMAKGQVQRGNTNKAKLTAKEKAKKKMEKKARAAKS
jgi:hypothetical protein